MTLSCPTAAWPLEPVNLGGEDMAEGEQVLLNWTAANRDPLVFGDPDRYDPERQCRRESGVRHRTACVSRTGADADGASGHARRALGQNHLDRACSGPSGGAGDTAGGRLGARPDRAAMTEREFPGKHRQRFEIEKGSIRPSVGAGLGVRSHPDLRVYRGSEGTWPRRRAWTPGDGRLRDRVREAGAANEPDRLRRRPPAGLRRTLWRSPGRAASPSRGGFPPGTFRRAGVPRTSRSSLTGAGTGSAATTSIRAAAADVRPDRRRGARPRVISVTMALCGLPGRPTSHACLPRRRGVLVASPRKSGGEHRVSRADRDAVHDQLARHRLRWPHAGGRPGPPRYRPW